MRMRSFKVIVLIAGFTVLQACETVGPLYYWGNYESLIYQMYLTPGKAPPQVQIERLTQDIQRAEGRGLRIPPGLYAHLGMMYAMEGSVAQAEEAFAEEVKRYPESEVFIQGMMTRVKTKNTQGVAL